MKILFLAPRLPLPADTGGEIRTWNILKQTAKFAKVHLVCFSFEDHDQKHAAQIEQMGIDVTLLRVTETPAIEKIFNVAFNSLPHSMVKYRSEAMKKVLMDLAGSRPFDAVHVDHLHMTHYRDCFPQRPCVVDEHNVEYKILERCVPVEKSFFKRAIFANQAAKMKKFEAEQLRDFSAYLAVSEDDKNILQGLVGAGVPGHVIPNGVDTEYFRVGPSAVVDNETALVFTGSMDWLPNDDAVLFFSREILPLIWKVQPEVKFYVVGKGPTTAIQDLAKADPRIIVTGRVDDVRPLMAQAKIFVVPIRVGGGTRLKILEAMSMHKAVVSTTVGAEGIQYTNGKNIAIADEPRDFAQTVLKLLNDAPAAGRLGEEGRKLVCGLYDWNIVGEKLKKIYEAL